MTYRSEPEDMSTPFKFDIAFLGYTKELSVKGLNQFAENNIEQVEKYKLHEHVLYLKDGTRITAIGSSEYLRGYRFDQLILFDDNRWNIKYSRFDEIRNIWLQNMNISNVPEEFKILEYEDIR